MQILEHIHLSVDSIAATERFISVAIPEYSPRGGGYAPGYGRWLHIGTDSSYIALTEVEGVGAIPQLRHIGVQVTDLEALMDRLQRAGFEPSDTSALDGHPHRRRIYYVDDNGLNWEFVQYLSEDAAQRNDYSH